MTVTAVARAVACAVETGIPQWLLVFRRILALESRRQNPEVQGGDMGIHGTHVRLRHSDSTAVACPVCARHPIFFEVVGGSPSAGSVALMEVYREVWGGRSAEKQEYTGSQLPRMMRAEAPSAQVV